MNPPIVLLLFSAALGVALAKGIAAETPNDPATSSSNAAVDTPLHLAVLRGDADAVDALLESGADPAAVNAAGATPLHYAMTNERIVAALLARGAPVNAVSKIMATPLLCAVVRPESFALVQRLANAGADLKYRIGSDVSVILNAAIDGGDRRTVEFLLDRGAEVNPAEGSLPLFAAAFGGDVEIVKLLLARGAKVNTRNVATDPQPLTLALAFNHNDIARLLIDHGAELNVRVTDNPTGPTNMVLSAYTDACDPAMARLLVERGVDIESASDIGETALSYALKRGTNNPLVAYLREAGAKEPSAPRRTKTVPSRDVPLDATARQTMVHQSVQRAIDLIQPSSRVFLETPMVRDQQKCTSCHHQDLPGVAMALARERGLRVDEHELGRSLRALINELSSNTETARQTKIFLTLPLGFHLDFLHAQRFAPDDVTEAIARSLLAVQRADGSWNAPVRRPPMEDGTLVATAWSARGLQVHPPAGRHREAELALVHARHWLAHQELRDLNDRVFQLLGIAWTNETAERMRPLAEQLIAQQADDGGWPQFPSLESDAWATGTALVALHKAGIAVSHEAYQRGVTFLLRTQFDDGSWWVRSRSMRVQPHFNGGFPHGKDQWISSAATAWSMMALLNTLEPTVEPGTLPTANDLITAFDASIQNQKKEESATVTKPIHAPASDSAGAVEFARDIQPILERSCVGCHGGERPKGYFNLTTRELLLKGGQSGEPAIVPGYADDSQLLQYASGKVEDLEMPPLDRRKKYPALSPEELEQMHTWIDSGAPWPATLEIRTTENSPTARSQPSAGVSTPES